MMFSATVWEHEIQLKQIAHINFVNLKMLYLC